MLYATSHFVQSVRTINNKRISFQLLKRLILFDVVNTLTPNSQQGRTSMPHLADTIQAFRSCTQRLQF